MKNNTSRRFLKLASLGLVATMAVSAMAGCGKKEAQKDDKDYTYNVFLEASPLNWNPHSWETNADNTFAGFCEMGLVDVTIGKDGGYEWVFEMAEDIEDITKDFADKAKWGIGDDETNRVWQIKLNKDAKWDDGTAINADTYVTSMKYLLDPTMKNYRANLYYDGAQSESAVLGAQAYYNNDLAGQTKYAEVAGPEVVKADTVLYFNFDQACTFFGTNSCADYLAAGYNAVYPVLDELNAYAGKGFVKVDDALKALLQKATADFGDPVAEDWVQFCFVEDGVYEEAKWEDVGFYKVDDYTLIYITTAQISQFNFFVHCTSNFLVKADVYEKGMDKTGELVTTNYGTSVDTYPAYGPYKLTSFEKDKMFVMERNENWYGYSDGKHDNQYQTTKIAISVVADHNTALQLFLSGQLDEIELAADDMATYRMSDELYQYDATYTFRWVFATDIEKLKELEVAANDGSNKTLLAYDDFRKALSLAMDRATFCDKATPGYSPAYYLINYAYYTDIENDPNSQYRYTDDAMKAVLNLYGIDGGDNIEKAYKSVTGFDKAEAAKLFTSAVEQAKKDGNYKDGQKVEITCMASAAASLSATDIAQQDALNEMVTAATVGTPLEGLVNFTFKSGAEDRYGDVAAGKVEMIRGAWGGAAFYPFNMIGSYTDPDHVGGLDKIHESCGWDPTKDTFELTYDFNGDGKETTEKHSFQEWTSIMNNKYAEDFKTRTFILAGIETAVLNEFRCIPWGAQTVSSLKSMKIKYGSETYDPMFGFGGIRLMTYNYDDEAWDAYVKEQGGKIDYE